jgi:hypothetical protein
LEKFVFLVDLHYGYERKGGHKVPLHDQKALNVALEFCQDFKPHHIILGGDILDCGAISHHNKGNPGRTEGLKLLVDAAECRTQLIEPLEALKPKSKTFITGNHERFITDLIDEMPSLEGIVDLSTLLKLDKWKIVPQGGMHTLGKLNFIHGDQLSGGEHAAKASVIAYEKNIRFGHFHTASLYSKTSVIHNKLAKTGMSVPCLCRKDPAYGRGKPNRWTQGFLYGYVGDGLFNDYLVVISDGRAVINGKLYKG